jgi:hypothetical protein
VEEGSEGRTEVKKESGGRKWRTELKEVEDGIEGSDGRKDGSEVE